MTATPHVSHITFTKRCSVCRWDAMSLEAQTAHRSSARDSWRARNPLKAARRDQILAGSTLEACECGSDEVTAFVTDYDRGSFIWRCAPCARAARSTYRRAEGTAEAA